MKALRNTLITALITLGLFSTVTYLACKKDRCNNVACLNGGSCDDGSCTCPTGFEGNRCQTPSRDKFIANFNGADSCTVKGFAGYHIRFLKPVSGNKTQMSMFGILNSDGDSALCTMESTDSFIFNGNNNATTYRGSGVIRNDSLHMVFHVLSDTTNYDCQYNGLRY
jgi:hypothetical protein